MCLMQFPFFVRIISGMKRLQKKNWTAILHAVLWVLVTTVFFGSGARVLFFGLPDQVAALIPTHSQAAASGQFEYRKQHASSTSEIPIGLRANAEKIEFDNFRVENL